MGIAARPSEVPDTSGLPEFFVTDIVTEITGSNVRVVCGAKRGGQVHWLYSVVMPAADMITAARECAVSACEAFNTVEMLAELNGHH